MIAPLTFGIYSSEPKVRRHIEMLKGTNRTFYGEDMYLLAGVCCSTSAQRPILPRR